MADEGKRPSLRNVTETPPPSRRGRPSLAPADILSGRKRIAVVAERLFQTEGFAAVSMRRLAKEAGCAPMTLYAYFDSKADILRLIWAGFLAGLFDDLDRQSQGIPNPEDRLVALARAYVRYWLDHPDRYRMVFMTHGVTQGEVGTFVEGGDILARFQLFAEALSATGAAPARLTLAYEALLSALIGVAHNQITVSAYPWSDGEAQAEFLAQAILAQAKDRASV